MAERSNDIDTQFSEVFRAVYLRLFAGQHREAKGVVTCDRREDLRSC